MVGGNEQANGLGNPICHFSEYRYNFLADKGITIAEGYEECRLDFCLLFNPAIGRMVRCRSHPRQSSPVNGEFGIGGNAQSALKGGGFCYGDNKFVLVGNVQGVDAIDEIVPSRLCVEGYNSIDDVFAGPLYLSTHNGGAKSLVTHCLCGEGVLNVFGSLGQMSNHFPDNMVQSGSEIVGGISNDEGELWRNGYLGFQYGRGPVAVFYPDEYEFKRLLGEVVGDLPIEIVDVMFGPLDLQSRRLRDVVRF